MDTNTHTENFNANDNHSHSDGSAGFNGNGSNHDSSWDHEGDVSHAQTVEEILDLDAQEKFKFQGKEYTTDEFMDLINQNQQMSQKHGQFAKEVKYYENLDADLAHVRQNPQLADQFRRVYPEKFHRFLDVIAPDESRQAGDQKGKGVNDPNLPQEVKDALKRLDMLEQKLEHQDHISNEQKVEQINQQLDVTFSKLGDKYPLAVEDMVLAKAQALLDRNRSNPSFKITEGMWDRLFKQSHKQIEERTTKLNRSRVKAQKERNRRAADTGRGGAAMGHSQKRRTFDEATEAMIAAVSKR